MPPGDAPEARLREAVRSPGFTPGRRDVEPLLDLLAGADDELAALVERALGRAPPVAGDAVAARWEKARGAARVRYLRVLQRLLGASARRFLLASLDDDDPRGRKQAARSLGKLAGDPDIEQALLARWNVETDLPVRRALAEALGKAGGEAGREALAEARTDDPELARLVAQGQLRAGRTAVRAAGTTLRADALPGAPLDVMYLCRAGLEALLEDELSSLAPRIEARGCVRVRVAASLAELLHRSRLALAFAFPLPPEPIGARGREAAVVAALTGPVADRVLAAHAAAPVRWRLAWEGGVHRRAETLRVALAVARARPALVNDPTASDWEATVRERAGAVHVELAPRGLPDDRFAYRAGDVYAASHPTIAAALVRAAGVRRDDLAWDPFVGSGLELCERARLGPYRALVGSDLDPRAIDVARANLAGAGAHDVTLAVGDVRAFRPASRATLVVTNPPMGRRVLLPGELAGVYEAFFLAAGAALAPEGRVAWITPRADLGVELASRVGLEPRMRTRVDMGGFDAELQVLVRRGAPGRAARRTSRPV